MRKRGVYGHSPPANTDFLCVSSLRSSSVVMVQTVAAAFKQSTITEIRIFHLIKVKANV